MRCQERQLHFERIAPSCGLRIFTQANGKRAKSFPARRASIGGEAKGVCHAHLKESPSRAAKENAAGRSGSTRAGFPRR